MAGRILFGHRCVKPLCPFFLCKRIEIMNSKQLASQIIKEFPGLRGFGIMDEDGKVYTEEGLILAYKNHVIAVDVKNSKVIDCGVFINSMSSISLEEFCIECWQEHFGEGKS
jgi:hypothetical protein